MWRVVCESASVCLGKWCVCVCTTHTYTHTQHTHTTHTHTHLHAHTDFHASTLAVGLTFIPFVLLYLVPCVFISVSLSSFRSCFIYLFGSFHLFIISLLRSFFVNFVVWSATNTLKEGVH